MRAADVGSHAVRVLSLGLCKGFVSMISLGLVSLGFVRGLGLFFAFRA